MHPRPFPDNFNKRVLLRRSILANLLNTRLLDAEKPSGTRRGQGKISQMTCDKEGKDCGHVIRSGRSHLISTQ